MTEPAADKPHAERLRPEVCAANRGLTEQRLVVAHSGNVSACDRASGTVLIKPSGADYDTLTPAMLVATDLQGRSLTTGMSGDRLRPSVDLRHHLFLYRAMPEIGAVVHTHSNYATSFAALGRSLPAYLTAIADEFGPEIPCAPYVDNQGDHIGEAIVRFRNQAPAILLAQHGAFCWGPTVAAAFKAAVMLEDVAHTCHLALQLGQPHPLPAAEVHKWFNRYHSTYGQQENAKGKAHTAQTGR